MKQAPRQANTGLYVKSANGLKLRDRKVSRLVQKMRTVVVPAVLQHAPSS
jgi:hypothetical protein